MKSKTTKVRRYLAAILTVLMIFQQATTSVIYASSEAAVPTVTEAPAAQTEEAPEKQVEETLEEKIPTEGESEQTETSTQDSADKQQEQTEEAQPTEEPQTEEAVTPAPETEIVSNEAPAVEMEAAALSAGTEESNNVPSATNTDLPSAWVKSQSVQKETNGIWTDIETNEQLDQNSTYHLNVTYEIPNTEKPQTDITYQYLLPSVFKEITSSGDIFNSSNEKMGTYNVEGGMILLNISAASIANLSNLNGYFSCEFKFDKTQITTEKTITVTFPVASKTETFHFQEDTNSYLSTEKKQLEVDYQKGKIKYQINVKANEAENAVVIKDTLGEGLSFDTNSFEIKKNGSDITLQPGYSADNKTAIFNLGNMAANDTCVIEYWAAIDNYSSMYNNGQNEVSVTKTNSYTYQSQGKTEQSGNSVTTTFHKKWAEKNGTYNAASKTIDWTITINAGSPLNINGAVIKDIPGINVSISDDANVTVTKDDGSTFTITGAEIKNGYTFTDADYMGKYVLSYTTVLPDNVQSTIGNVNVKNDYEFNNGKEQIFTGSKEIGVETIPAVTKECTYFTNNNSGANTADWKATVTIASSGKHVFHDELQDGMTLVDKSVKVTDKDGTEVQREVQVNSDKKAFQITFPNETVENGNPIQYVITYKSNYDHSKIPTTGTVSTTKYTYKNKCKLDDNPWVNADFTVQGGEILNKQQADGAEYDEANKTIRYKIVVNWANLDYTGKEVVVKDVLPEGTTFSGITSMFKVQNGNCPNINNSEISNIVTVDTHENGVVYFRFKDIGSLGYGFNYELKVNDEYYKKTQRVEFKNSASLIVNGTIEKEDSHSVWVDFKVVKKESQQHNDSGNHKTNYIKYTVTINPAAVQLLPDNLTSGGLTLTDIIPDNLTLVINKTFPMTLRNTKDQSDNPALGYSYDSSTRKLVVNVPDQKALELVFYAQLSGKAGENVSVSNTVNLSGSATYSVTDTDSKQYQVVQSSAGLNGDNNHIRLKKTKEDASTPLKGAKFDIVKVSIDDEGNVTTQTIGNHLEVGNDGGLTYPREGTNDEALIADTLYYYQEVEAPQGYQVDSGKYYFWNPGNDKETLNNRIQDAVGKGKLDATAKTANTNLYGEIIVTNKAAVGSLKITKQLVAPEDFKNSKSYTFTVSKDGKYYDQDGKTYVGATVTVGAGQMVEVKNLPIGEYTVTERNASVDGYTWTVSANGTVGNEATVTVKNQSDTNVTFTNTYQKFDGASLNLKASKLLEGGTLEAGAYEFVVTADPTADVIIPNGKFTNDADGNIAFNGIEFKKAGDYTLTIKEKTGADVGIAYDNTVYTVKVNIATDSDSTANKLKVNEVKSGNDTLTERDGTYVLPSADKKANFINRVKKGSLKITKTLEVPDGFEKSKVYTFTVSKDGVFYDKDGNTGAGATVSVEAGKTVEVKNLPIGKYTVTETDASVEGYSWTVTANEKPGSTATVEVTDNTFADVIFKNIYNQTTEEKVDISGTKTWSDGGNQDGSRPSSITVNLLANGTKVDSKTVTAKDNWKYSFTDLPKYENGTAINYTVTEDAVAGYSTTINGYDITNSYTPGRTSVTVTKAWVDNDNKGNKRPSEIKVQLYADGRESGSSVTLNEANKWTYTWTGLDEKNGGTTIAYTVKEIGTVDGYEASVSGDARTGYTITNTLKSGTLEIVKSITGDISDSALTAEQKAAMTFTVIGPDGYSETVHYSDFVNGKYTFQNLPLGEYIVTETNADMEGYKLTTTYSVDGGKVTVTNKETATITITNDYTKTKDVSVKISKVDADTYEVLGGAHLQVIDPDGKVVAEWDSDKDAYTLTDLKPGVVYTLHETAAPKGYKVAEDTTFQLNEDGTIDTANTTTAISGDTLLVKDEKNDSKDVSVSVTKKLVTVDGTVIGAVDATYYVALYSDADCTERVSDVLALNFKNASSSTVTFTGLEKGQTYYVGECESDGTCYLANICADGTMYMVDFSDGNAVTVDNADGSTTVYFDNQFENIPDGYYKEAELNITKKLVGSDGKAKNSNEIFYAGIFADEGFTQLSTDVSANIVPLDLAGGSEATAQVNVALPESGSITLYVTEVDSNGKPVAGAASFKYDVTVDNAQVTLNDDNLSANVVITNTENSTKVTPTPGTPNTPNTPNTTGGFSGKSAVRTGDSTPIGGFIALFAAAAVIAGAAVFFKRRRKDEK